MRIGILTYHWVYNFGANLQVLATCELLKDKGHDPIVLNFVHEDLEEFYHKRIPKEQWVGHTEFIKRHLPLTAICHTEEELISVCKEEKIEAIIVGSDAVLMINLNAGLSDTKYPNPFWLNWKRSDKYTNNIPAALLSASSMGSYYFKFNSVLKQNMNKSFKNFSHISVRDKWTSWMLRYIIRTKQKVHMSPDPVSVLSKVKKLEQLDLSSPYPSKYILFSSRSKLITQEWVDALKKIAYQNGLKVGELPMPEGSSGLDFDFKVDMPLDALEWYRYIINSDGYIGERFHASVVSLYNNIPFVIFDTYANRKLQLLRFEFPSKIYDLCRRSGFLKNRITSHEIDRLTPQKAFQLLETFDKQRCEEFTENEQNIFSGNLDILLDKLEGNKI